MSGRAADADRLRETARRICPEAGEIDGLDGLWLGGSLGRGEGDGFSDLDYVGLASETARRPVAAAWADWLGARHDLVYLKNHGVLVNAITRDWLRIDLVVETEAAFLRRPRGEVLTLWDSAGVAGRLAEGAEPLAMGPRTQARTEEFLRVLGLIRVGLGRDDTALGAEGFWHLRGLLKEAMLDDARPDRRHGALSLRAILAQNDYRLLREFSQVTPERHALIDAHRRIARAYLTRARARHAALGLDWPEAFETATREALVADFGAAIDWSVT